MSVPVGKTINDFADYFLRMPIFATISSNPIYTAIAITCIIMIIIAIVFRNGDFGDESLALMTLRCGFAIFFATTGMILLHNKVLELDTDVGTKKGEYDEVFTTSIMRGGLDSGDIVPVGSFNRMIDGEF